MCHIYILFFSPANWMRGSTSKKPKEPSQIVQCLKLHCDTMYITNNLPQVTFTYMYIVLVCALFVCGCIRYLDKNGYVIVARGCGACLNVLAAIIVMFMLRRTLTWLRNSKIGQCLPIDDSILFHKVVGFSIAAFSLLHTIMHLINIGKTTSQLEPGLCGRSRGRGAEGETAPPHTSILHFF